MSDFLAMGGYGAYVWPAYGFAAFVLIVLLVQSWRAARQRAAELERLRHLTRPARPRTGKLRVAQETDRPSMPRPATE